MPRARRKKTSDVPTRIYSFRCLPPITEADRVEQQFRLAHQYRNALVEIEHKLWEGLRDVQLADPVVGEALRRYEDAAAGVDAVYDDLRAAKSGVADPDLTKEREKLVLAKELRALFAEELRTAKADQIAQLKPGYGVVRTRAAESRKQARRSFIDRGLRTGTYDRVEKSVEHAAKTAKRPLYFEPYDGTGSIGTQLIATGDAAAGVYGMTVAELLSGQDTRIRLGSPGAADAHPRAEVQACTTWEEAQRLGRNVRRHAARTYVDLRMGSQPNRAPIFARFPVTLHRLLPKDAVIKWAYVVRRRIGRHYEWRFQLTLESESFRPCPVAIGTGACALDLGWRRLFDEEGNQIGLRAGYLVDETGHEREIRVPQNMLAGMAKIYDLASIRDKEFETARDRLAAWLRDREIPAGLTDRLIGLAQWRAPRKLQSLIDAWTGIDWGAWRAARAAGKKCNPSDFGSATNRFADDKEILASLQAWSRQDRHLQSWQEHQRNRLIAHRRETWRVIAAELTGRYAKILIEDGMNQGGEMRLPEIDGWERPAPEDGDPSDGREQRRMSRLAAPGELRAEIIEAAPKRGAIVDVERTQGTTQECAWCGCTDLWDATVVVEHTCASCGRTWDQDANACRNLLHRHGLASGPVPPRHNEVHAPSNRAKSSGTSGASAHAVLDRAR